MPNTNEQDPVIEARAFVIRLGRERDTAFCKAITHKAALFDAQQLLKALADEVETLRKIAEEALRFRVEVNGACEHDEYMIKLCTQCEIRAVLNRETLFHP